MLVTVDSTMLRILCQ